MACGGERNEIKVQEGEKDNRNVKLTMKNGMK